MDCAGPDCNSIVGNRNETMNGTATDGATILAQDDTDVVINRVSLRDNRGGNIIRAFPSEAWINFEIYNSAARRQPAPERWCATAVRNS